MAKFMVHTSLGFAGCTHHDEFEIPDQELAGLTREEVENLVWDYAKDIAHEHLDYGITVGGEKDYSEFHPERNKTLADFELIPLATDEEGE